MAHTDRNFHSIGDLWELYDQATEFATSGDGFSSENALCRWFYRNNTPEYFKEILTKRGRIMETELKDPSGDPRSPINGRVNGIFFTASVHRGSTTGEPIPKSPFGSCGLLVPAKELLDSAPNLYFTDFYCMTKTGNHWVTLVMTVPGSKADQFCDEFLPDLRIESNPFLAIDRDGQLRVTTKQQLFVEIFYTEDLYVGDYELQYGIPPVGKGRSTPGGIAKNKHCAICNLA